MACIPPNPRTVGYIVPDGLWIKATTPPTIISGFYGRVG